MCGGFGWWGAAIVAASNTNGEPIMSKSAKGAAGTKSTRRATARKHTQSSKVPSSAASAQRRKPRIASRPDSKVNRIVALLRQKEGATIADMQDATGWQAHSVRGAISGALKKKLGLTVSSEKVNGRGRIYRIVANG
jgi:hypothetical protein